MTALPQMLTTNLANDSESPRLARTTLFSNVSTYNSLVALLNSTGSTVGQPLVSGGSTNGPSYAKLDYSGIADDAVREGQIKDGAVTVSKLAVNGDGSGNLKANCVYVTDALGVPQLSTLVPSRSVGIAQISNTLGADKVLTTDSSGNPAVISKTQLMLSGSSTVSQLANHWYRGYETDRHYGVVTGTRTLKMVGRNNNGQLGVGSTSDMPYFVDARFNVSPPISAYIKYVVLSYGSTYCLWSNGWVYAAGHNGRGQLGQQNTTNLTMFYRIEWFLNRGGGLPALYVRDVFCTGDGATTQDRAFFTVVENPSDLDPLAVPSTDLYGVGDNNYGALGVGNTTTTTYSTPQLISAPSNIAKIVGSGWSIYILTRSGEIWSCGQNTMGQLASGNTTTQSNFQLAQYNSSPTSPIIVDVKVFGSSSSCCVAALDSNKFLWICGYNSQGQCGLTGNTTNNLTTQKFSKNPTLSGVASFGCSGGGTGALFAVTDTGDMYTWGTGANGILGRNTSSNQTTPGVVVGYREQGAVNLTGTPPFQGKIVKAVGYGFGGSGVIIVLDSDGRLWGCGVMGSGVAGVVTPIPTTQATGQYVFQYIAAPILDIDEEILDIDIAGHSNSTASNLTSFILTSRGRLFASGYNTNGTVGLGYPGLGNVYSFQLCELK